MTRSVLVCLFAFAACRVGGRGGDALALVEPVPEAGPDAAAEAGPPLPSFDSGSPPEKPPSEALDAQMPAPQDGGGLDGAAPDGEPVDAVQCEPAVLPGCDPVRNEGCEDGVTQCVLNPLAAEPTGHCVVSSFESAPCLESLYSTTCPPQHACVEGACRRFCSCDSDCSNGATCSAPLDAVQSGEVRLCASSP